MNLKERTEANFNSNSDYGLMPWSDNHFYSDKYFS